MKGINILTELRELDAWFYGQEDINHDGGPNDAMRVRILLSLALPRLTALVEAASDALEYVGDAGKRRILRAAIATVNNGTEQP